MPLSGSFTQSFQQLVLDALGQRTVFDPAIDGLKLALFTADPGEGASTGNEISGGGYTRQSVVLGDATNNASNHGEIANTGAISFAASGASWSGITHAGLFKAKSLTRSIVGKTNSTELGTSGEDISDTKLLIPSSHSTLDTTLTISGAGVVDADASDGSTDLHVVLTYSETDGSYYQTNTDGFSKKFVKIKTGPCAGMCFDIVGDGTNTITLDTYFKFSTTDVIGQKIEIRNKLTLDDLAGVTHGDSNSFDSNGYSPSGLFGGSTSTADRFYTVKADGTNVIYFLSNAPAFSTGIGWRNLSSGSTDAGDGIIQPAELWNHMDQTGDSYNVLRTYQNPDWTLTSQLSTTDEMLARFQFEDSGGNAQTLNVADGSSLDVAIGDLKLTLN